MPPRLTPRRTRPVAAVAIIAMLAFAGTAAAFLTGSSGGGQVRMDNRAETSGAFTNSLVWVDLPGSAIPVNIANASALVNARFTAESRCGGPNAGICAVRIIAMNAAGGIIELDPASGMDHAFDSDVPGAADVDLVEAHAMERSRRLTQGNWSLRVQRAVAPNNTVGFGLDDWHFAVETSV